MFLINWFQNVVFNTLLNYKEPPWCCTPRCQAPRYHQDWSAKLWHHQIPFHPIASCKNTQFYIDQRRNILFINPNIIVVTDNRSTPSASKQRRLRRPDTKSCGNSYRLTSLVLMKIIAMHVMKRHLFKTVDVDEGDSYSNIHGLVWILKTNNCMQYIYSTSKYWLGSSWT